MPDHDRLHFTAQALPSAIRDTVSNRYWIGLALVVILVWVFASSTAFYFLQCGHGDKCVNFGDSVYFTAINVTTVGFGDISPINGWTKALAVLNALVGLISFGILVAIFSAALQPSGFSGTGEIAPARGGPKGDTEDRKDARPDGDANPERAAALRFLTGLGELVGSRGESRHSEVRIRVRGNSNLELGADVSIHVFIERWPY